jgi:hypothetical protein
VNNCTPNFNCVRTRPKTIYDISATLDDNRPSDSTVEYWVVRFRTGHLSTEIEERSVRPILVTVPENVKTIQSMILDDSRTSTKKIVEAEEISRDRVLHYSRDFRYEKALNQMGSQMS